MMICITTNGDFMKAIILAGGRGTRLQSVIKDCPKPLVPVQGEPFLNILFRFLIKNGVSDIVVSIGYMAEAFYEWKNNFHGTEAKIKLIEERVSLGTGGAVRFACQDMKREQSILVLNGDTFFNFDLLDFISTFKNQNAIALRYLTEASRYGSVDIRGEKVTGFREKSVTFEDGLIYAGYSLLNVSDIFDLLPEGTSSLEKDFFPSAVHKGRLKGKSYDGDFIDIGIPEDYDLANKSFNFSIYGRGSQL